MRAIRYILQVCTFVCFAAWFLCLVSGGSLRLPELPPPVLQPSPSPPAAPAVKPSPIDMLKRTASGHYASQFGHLNCPSSKGNLGIASTSQPKISSTHAAASFKTGTEELEG